MEIRSLFEKMELLGNLHDVQGFMEEIHFDEVVTRTEHITEYFGEHGSRKDDWKAPRREEHRDVKERVVIKETVTVVVNEHEGKRGGKRRGQKKRY